MSRNAAGRFRWRTRGRVGPLRLPPTPAKSRRTRDPGTHAPLEPSRSREKLIFSLNVVLARLLIGASLMIRAPRFTQDQAVNSFECPANNPVSYQ